MFAAKLPKDIGSYYFKMIKCVLDVRQQVQLLSST